MNTPLISVITVVYNAQATLESTIKSVINQEKGLFEYWIIDGGSTDGSVDVIRRYEHQLAGWCSEPDRGIYDAMNKGINRVNGKWLYFLGADDILQPNILKKICLHLELPYKVVFGNIMFNNNRLFYSSVGLKTLMQNTLHHQGAFYHYSLFNNFRYDPSLAIQADYELNIYVYVNRTPTKYVPLLIAVCALGGKSAGHTEKSFIEINTVRSRYVTDYWKNKSLSFLLRLYYWQKQFRFWLYGHQV